MKQASTPDSVTVLGATGSVGLNTLDVVGQSSGRFRLEAVTAHRNARALADLARRHGAAFAAVADPASYSELKDALAGSGIACGAGPEAIVEAAERPASRVMAAIVGAAGLAPTLAALRRGATVMLANKECLVCAGRLFMDVAASSGARILPVDSEHSAVFQALEARDPGQVETVTITASGGPFRTWDTQRMATARPEEAVRHPNWSMGAKISVDSATLMNKGLELIEARHLFALAPDTLRVLIHPESIVHGLVSYVDGAVIAQMAAADMRTPIAYALGWPDRIPAPTARLDLASLGSLTFEEPDTARFPALRLAREAMEAGGGAPTILNAANEIAVDAYLKTRINFPDIAGIVETVMDRLSGGRLGDPTSLEDAMELDARARDHASSEIPARLATAG